MELKTKKARHVGKLDGTERCAYCGCIIGKKLCWSYNKNDVKYCNKHRRNQNYIKNETYIYSTIGLNLLTFVNNNIRQTIDLGDSCKSLYDKYVVFSSIYFFDEEIVSQIIFNKILKSLFNTDYIKTSGKHIWDNLVYQSE